MIPINLDYKYDQVVNDVMCEICCHVVVFDVELLNYEIRYINVWEKESLQGVVYDDQILPIGDVEYEVDKYLMKKYLS